MKSNIGLKTPRTNKKKPLNVGSTVTYLGPNRRMVSGEITRTRSDDYVYVDGILVPVTLILSKEIKDNKIL